MKKKYSYGIWQNPKKQNKPQKHDWLFSHSQTSSLQGTVTLRAREQRTELLVKVAKWFHLLRGSSSSHRLWVATVLQVLSLSHGWIFTQGREERYGNEKPGVIWISNYNADITSFSERFYPTFQILKSLGDSNRDDTVWRCVMLQDLSLFYSESVASFLFLELSIFSSIISGSKRYIQKVVRMSAVCQNKALIGYDRCARGSQQRTKPPWTGYLSKLRSKYEYVIIPGSSHVWVSSMHHEITRWKVISRLNAAMWITY